MKQNPLERKPQYTEEEAQEEAERMKNIVKAGKGERTYADAANWLKKIDYEVRPPFDKNELKDAENILWKLFSYDYENLSEEERDREIEEYLPQLAEHKNIFVEAYETKPGLMYDITRMASGNVQGGGVRQRERMEEIGREIIAELMPKIVDDFRKGSSNAWLMQAIILFAESPDGEQERLGVNTLVSLLDIIEEKFSDKGNNHIFLRFLELICDKGTREQELKVAETITRLAEKNKGEPECGKLASILLKSYFTATQGFEIVNSILELYNLPLGIVDLWKKSGSEPDKIVEKNLTAIIQLEKEKTGACQFLYKEFGIADFGRYPNELLLKQIEEADNLENPYGVVLFPRNDWNGAFYQDSFALKELFDKCKGEFSIRVVECEGKIGIARMLLKLNKKYNTPDRKGHKISLAIIGGHGTENSIRFGGNEDSNALLTTDLMGRGVQRTSEFFEANPTIILVSCSTGADKGIGQKLSGMMGAKVIAPKVPTNIREIQVGKRRGGKFRFNAKYSKDEDNIKSVFVGGAEK